MGASPLAGAIADLVFGGPICFACIVRETKAPALDVVRAAGTVEPLLRITAPRADIRCRTCGTRYGVLRGMGRVDSSRYPEPWSMRFYRRWCRRAQDRLLRGRGSRRRNGRNTAPT